MLQNCDSVRKGLIYTPIMHDNNDDDAGSFEQKRGVNYQHEYMRLYIANVVLTQQLKELLQEKGDLVQKITRLEDSESTKIQLRTQWMKNVEDSAEQPKKSKDTMSAQQKVVKSHMGIDTSLYESSEGSLNQHMKLKHCDENANPNHSYQTRKQRKI